VTNNIKSVMALTEKKVSKAEIARVVGISVPTVHSIMLELMSQNEKMNLH